MEKTKISVERISIANSGVSSDKKAPSPELTTVSHSPSNIQRQAGNNRLMRLIQGPQAKLSVSSPQDREEKEADEVAAGVVSGQKMARISRLRPGVAAAPIHRQPSEEKDEEAENGEEGEEMLQAVRISRQEEEEEEEEEVIQAKAEGKGEEFQAEGDSTMEAQIKSPGAGRPLPDTMRSEMEAGLGMDLSDVRVHDTAQDGAAAEGLNAKAFAYRNHIWLSPGASIGDRKLMAHELTHVVQQGSAGSQIQRYESGEHATLGETQDELKAAYGSALYTIREGDRLSAIARKFGISIANLKAANKDKVKKWPAVDGSGRMIEGFNAGETVIIPPVAYKVLKGDRLSAIAGKFGIPVDELKALNKDKLKAWPAVDGSGCMIEGFNAGETITIRQEVNEFAESAMKGPSATFTVNGVVLDYGVGIAMGDFFESPEQMAKASPKELKELAALIKREQSGGKPVTTAEWEKATGGRYLKLAEKNEAHFAPPSAGLVTPSSAGAASANHKDAWEQHHKAAVDTSKAGDKDQALMTNAFGDHFLTDAFSAGHLINKRDVMEKFKGQLQLDAKGEEFTASSKVFFNAIATDAFTGSVKTEFSKYETYEAYAMGWNPNINSVSRFSTLLQGIHKEKPDLLANAMAKGVHDQLNTIPGGLPVENAKGDRWNLSGDGTLNGKTKEIARKAVAQSQFNVISKFKTPAALKYADLFKKVWDFTPRPSAAGIKQVASELKKGAEIKSKGLRQSVVNLIKKNYKLIIDELVKLKKLKKA